MEVLGQLRTGLAVLSTAGEDEHGKIACCEAMLSFSIQGRM